VTTGITDIYELSPMQKAMLFHALHSPGSGTSFNQFSCRLSGDLAPDLFRDAWRHLVERHPVLRTSFHWEELDKPVQIVHEMVDFPWLSCDWRQLSAESRSKRWRDHLAEDIARGFQLDKPPLMRWRTARVGEQEYLFSWSHHHLLTDGWCLTLVMKEVLAIYGQLRAGLPLSLPPVRPYRDYIAWLQLQDAERARQFWTRYLEGFRSATPMPAGVNRNDRWGGAVVQLNSELPEPLSTRLHQFTARHQLTLSTLVQGAWSILLSRYSGEIDIVFGTTVSGRPSELTGVETMLGLFINTVPVRMRVDARQPLVPWLKMIQARQAARSRFEYAALPDIQRWSEVPGGSPLFESNFVFMNYPLDQSLARGAYGLEIGDVELYDRADVPIELQATPATRWKLDLAYDPARFDRESMRRMLGHVGALLESFVEDPGRLLGRFSILTEPERRQLVYGFNDTDADDFDPSLTIVHRLEALAVHQPDSMVLECGDRILSLGELNARANRLARWMLRQTDLGPDDRVAILAPRSDRMVEAILAIWKCGAAYVPIDPDYPAKRIEVTIEASQAKLVLTESSLLGAELDEDDADLDRTIDPRSLAYVIFTSGSTGTPKGAMVEHAGMLNHLLAKIEELKLGPASVVAQNASHCFDISVWQFFAAPLAGGRTVILSHELVMDPVRFLRAIQASNVTILELVPSYLSVALEHGAEALRKLDALLVTGEPVSPTLIERWFGKFPDIPVINAYGPTEAADDITHHRMARPPRTRVIPVGKPIRNMRVYIVDEQTNLCPIGINGEICVSGIGVGRGYLNDHEGTKAAFLEDPFRVERGVRMFRTGDIGRFCEGGVVLLAGRKDRQVKIHGQRVELDEIENALVRMPEVKEAAVVARRGNDGKSLLCAYVVFRNGASMTEQDLVIALSDQLPDYMLPGIYIAMQRLPLTRNGKTDRAALPVPARRAAVNTDTSPRTPAEKVLCAIWRETLRIESLGINDNFFALGGDSILSMQIVARAGRAGLKLTTRQVFHNPTVAELARVAAIADPKSAGTTVVDGPLPLTPMQRRFFDRRQQDLHHYNQAVLLEVSNLIDAVALKYALGHVARVHDALRLRFTNGGSGWRQQVVAETDVPLDIHEIASHELADRIEVSHAGLDLSDGPLFRADLFRFDSSGPGRLLIVAHHLAIDAVSWGILLDTLSAAYRNLRAGEPLQSEASVASWATWVTRLVAWGRAGAANSAVPYWLALASANIAPLPLDYPQGRGRNYVDSAEEVIVELGESATHALLRETSRAYNTRPGDLLLAALALTIGEWTGETGVLVDLEAHGREEIFDDLDVSRTVGWFTAQFPFFLEISEGISATIKSAKERHRAVPDNGLSFGMLGCLTEHAAIADAIPKPQLLFNYLGQVDKVVSADVEWKMALEPSGSGRSPRQLRDHPIALNSCITGNRLRVAWEFSRNLHRRSTIERLAARYLAHLETIIDHCADPANSGFTPSDFPEASLSQSSVDALAAAVPGEIEDVYALTPTQQGMLFHSIHGAWSDAYLNHLNCLIEGDLDTNAFRQAWQRVIERHAVLRTSFHWEGIKKPVQVVHRKSAPDWVFEDFSGLPAAEAAARWQQHLKRDRTLGFELAPAPPMRFSLFFLGGNAWRFNWSLHHILLDGWSCALLLREVTQIYEALRFGREPKVLPAWPFREYVSWLRRQDTSGAEQFWKAKLKGFAAPTRLFEAVPALGRYAEEEVLLPGPVTESLFTFAHANGLTLNTLAQGAWAALLGRYSGEPDIVYGTIVMGRPASLPHADTIAGLFINTLPVRVRVDGAAVVPWLRRLQADLVEQDEFSYCALADIQQWSEVPGGTPLFDTLLIFQNYPTPAALEKPVAGLRLAEFQAFDPNDYPMTLVVTPGERVSLRALYDSTCFDSETIARLLRHYETLLLGLVDCAEKPVALLPLLTEAERRRIVVEWNATETPVPAEKTVVDLFEAQAAATPERVAVRCGFATLTYCDLSRRSDRLARHLLSQGDIRADQQIAILMPRSERMVEAVLAIWKCGAAYVPIDPDYPASRIEALLAGSRPRLVLATPETLGKVTPGIPVVNIDALGELIEARRLEPRCRASDLAYVIFTSGSTGKPKGAMIEHSGMLNHLLSMVHDLGLDERSVVAQTASHCFDISVWQFFAPLLCGGQTVVYPDSIVLEPRRLIQDLEHDAVSTAQLVPSYLTLLLAELENGGAPPPIRLKGMATIGEALKPALVRAWFRLNPNVPLINRYGPTEASDSIACYKMDEPPELSSIPIGRPIQNLRLYVVDRYMNLCPIGVKGEICVSGVGVGRGYLSDEEHTRAVFSEDPFLGVRGVRLYHTGDIGCYAADGNILFFGRKDFQVKIRGHRIEPGEIEVAITSLEGIGDAVVVDREEPNGRKYLCAYVTRSERSAWEAAGIRDALTKELPAHMIPDVIMMLPSLPVTPNGKIDRAALPLADARSTPSVSYVPAQTPVEAALVGIWEEVLGCRQVGIDNSFFDLGGHSLKAVQILSRVRGDLDTEVGIADIFSFPTIRAFAERLNGTPSASQAPIAPLPPQAWYAASHTQKRIWLASRRAEGSAYNMAGALDLKGRIDASRVDRSLEALIERHESLRTVFAIVEGELKQRVQSVAESGFCVEHITGEAGLVDALMRREAGKPFDLAAGPLFRAKLIRLAAERHVLLLTMHHIVSDAWSVRVMTSDLLALYRGGKLEPLTIQYRDYAAWHNNLLGSRQMRSDREYWLAKVAGGIARLEIATDFPRADRLDPAGGTIVFDLDRQLVRSLGELAAEYHTSLYCVVLSAIGVLLRGYTGAEDIVIGSQTAGRDREELEAQVGAFLNTIILRLPVRGRDTIGTVIETTRSVLLEAVGHSAYPFDLLLEELRIRTQPNRGPGFDVQVDYIPSFGRNARPELDVLELEVTDVSINSDTSKYDLTFQIVDEEGSLQFLLIYNRRLFRRETIETMRDRLVEIQQAFVRDRRITVDRLVLTPNAPAPKPKPRARLHVNALLPAAPRMKDD
jgi:amino acid adenylation domain-containing protein/non-ribosomal peptide synthase protein (TIGR01720 family)